MEALISGGVAGGLIAVALGAIELAKVKMNGKNGHARFFGSADREHLDALHSAFITNPDKDTEGLPLWYFPRGSFERMGDELEEQTGYLREVRDSIKELCLKVDK